MRLPYPINTQYISVIVFLMGTVSVGTCDAAKNRVLLQENVSLHRLTAETNQKAVEDLKIEKLELERDNLQLEKNKLLSEQSGLSRFSPILLAILTAAVSAIVSLMVATRSRKTALDEHTHQARLDCYGKLVSKASALAIYFPQAGAETVPVVTQDRCREMGQAISQWYFQGGGLLMSNKARKAYFSLAKALTRASSFNGKLAVPMQWQYADDIDDRKIDEYRSKLGIPPDMDSGQWTFGAVEEPQNPAMAFKDFVFLQTMSSRLRTALAEDLGSRRLLDTKPLG